MIHLSDDIVATGTAGPAAGAPLAQLVARLRAEGIRYCHWKGSLHLPRVLSGEGDLDLLVDRRDAGRFEGALALLGFKRAVAPVRPTAPAVLHFYGLDPASGALLHLHVYYRLVAGESLLDNYRLPLEELLLRDVRTVDGVPVARAPAALVVFVLRTMLSCASLSEQLLMGQDGGRVRAKLEALLEDGAEEKAEGLLAEWLPAVPAGLFRECLAALRGGASWLRR